MYYFNKIFFYALLSLLTFSCAQKYTAPMIESQSTMTGLTASDDKQFLNSEPDRKILYAAYLSLIVKDPDSANVQLKGIAEKYNGYVSESGAHQSVIRVKSQHLDDAISEISQLGKVSNRNIQGMDVTDEYLDYEIRLDNAEKARERYLELLSKAEHVEAALKVEKELERLNETIDLLKGYMNRINHLEEFSTITISLNKKVKPGILGYIGMGLYYSVKWLFVRN